MAAARAASWVGMLIAPASVKLHGVPGRSKSSTGQAQVFIRCGDLDAGASDVQVEHQNTQLVLAECACTPDTVALTGDRSKNSCPAFAFHCSHRGETAIRERARADEICP